MTTIQFSRQLFESVLNELPEEPEEIANTINSLFFMFKDEITESLALLEAQCITLLYTSNQRQVYEVRSSNKIYHCFKYAYFCTCFSFKHNVVKTNEIMLCKHQIACRLAERIKKCKYKQITDDYLINLFKNAEERSSSQTK